MPISSALTVLFADITESSELYHKLGDEAAKTLIHKGLEGLSEVVNQCHGRPIKTIGDEIMAVFDEPSHAIEAALLMQKILDPLSLRIGLHHGPVIVEEADVFGNAVNVASRLVTKAKPMQILADCATIENARLEGLVTTRFVDKMSFKGQTELFDVHEILSNTAEDSEKITICVQHDFSIQGGATQAFEVQYQNRGFLLDDHHNVLKMGRDASNHIVVPHPLVSRFHAKLLWNHGQCFLEDQSVNGTYFMTGFGESLHIHHSQHLLIVSGILRLGPEEAIQKDHDLVFKVLNKNSSTKS
jgi:hypothetical protein